MNMHQASIAMACLTAIAAFDEGTEVGGTFDCPSAARAARRALRGIEQAREDGINCLVTGCALIDPINSRVVWGDLHCLDHVAIFNACLSPTHEAAWTELGPMLDTTPSCTLAEGQEIFERRAVIIFDLVGTTLNAAAQKRMSPHG